MSNHVHRAFFLLAFNLSRKVIGLIQAVLETDQSRTETSPLKMARDLSEYINQRWLLMLQHQL
jgi:hypothetical protein